MQVYNNIKGAVRPQDVLIQGNQVYVASDIQPFTMETDGQVSTGYQYTWTVYDKDEYLIKLAHENAQLKQDIIDTQLALVEIYEGGVEE